MGCYSGDMMKTLTVRVRDSGDIRPKHGGVEIEGWTGRGESVTVTILPDVAPGEKDPVFGAGIMAALWNVAGDAYNVLMRGD